MVDSCKSALEMSVVFGDIFGFLALILLGLTSLVMLLRSKILKAVRNITFARSIHVLVASLAGVFMVLHVSYYYSVPLNTAILLGYVSFTIAVAVWLTGTAFLERLKESYFFHGALSIAVIALATIHAMAAGTNFPLFYSEAVIGTVTGVAIANMAYQLSKIRW